MASCLGSLVSYCGLLVLLLGGGLLLPSCVMIAFLRWRW